MSSGFSGFDTSARLFDVLISYHSGSQVSHVPVGDARGDGRLCVRPCGSDQSCSGGDGHVLVSGSRWLHTVVCTETICAWGSGHTHAHACMHTFALSAERAQCPHSSKHTTSSGTGHQRFSHRAALWKQAQKLQKTSPECFITQEVRKCLQNKMHKAKACQRDTCERGPDARCKVSGSPRHHVGK